MTVPEHARPRRRLVSTLISGAALSALLAGALAAPAAASAVGTGRDASAGTAATTSTAAAAPAPTPAPDVDRIPGQPGLIWFDEPLPTDGDAQRQWEQRALPIGNGAMGAVVYGGVQSEQLQLNEKTLWTGGPGSAGGYDYGNWTDDRTPADMQAVQQMIQDSPTGGVSPEVVADLLGSPKKNFGSYQTYGDLKLDMAGLADATDYRRQLDIATSLVTTTFTSGGVTYTREYFASAADDVIVVRLTADQPGRIGFTTHVDLPDGRSGVSNTAAAGRITTKGTLSGNGMRFESQTQVVAEGGSRTESGAAVTVANADSAMVVFSAATDYAMEYDTDYRNGIDPHVPVTAAVDAAANAGYGQLLARHTADYTGLFDRAALDLGAALPNIPTDELLAQYRSSIDPESARALEALFFQYGRYLLISSSREGSLPANLQGVWNRSNNPPWDADYHVNINLQMNYWPAETTNLSETTGPFFDYVDSMVDPGTVTASEMYGARGWVTGNETNPFGFTGLHEYPYSFWQPDAAAWLAQHYYEHYLFTEDEQFLQERAYPTMKSLAQFWFDFLIVDPRDGSLVVSPSYSPEQGEFSAGASISQQIVSELLTHTKEASALLGETDAAFLGELDATLADLDPGLRVGSWGQLQEWKSDWDQQGNQHRHVSHLFGVYPGSQISPALTPELAAAAEVSLNDRGDGGTGWSKAWKINFWARLLDGDRSHKMLSEQLKASTLDNLWDDHPPFQIDGNFGATSGIAEMLLQSHAGSIDVLPALPSAWPDGSFSGLKARGDVEVDAAWQGGAIRDLAVTPTRSGPVTVSSTLFAPGFFQLVDAAGDAVPYTLADGAVTFTAEAGQRYEATAELAVRITAPATATSGETVEATVEVSATGRNPIVGGSLAITVPADTAEGILPWSAEPATLTLPDIPAGESRTETIRVRVGAGNAQRQSPVTATLTAGEASVSSTAVLNVKAPTPCPVPAAEGTLLAWDLGESPLTDASGNGVVPMVDGTAPVVADGPTGSAQRLDDTGYVRSASPVSLGYLEETTLAGEFFIDADQPSYRRLFDTQPVGGDTEGILVDLTPSNNVRIITAGVGTVTSAVLPSATWVDLAVTIGTDGGLTVYVDGTAKATASIAGYQAVNACAERTFHVGANRGGGERQHGFADRIAVFPRALDAEEVRSWQDAAFGVEQCATPAPEGTLLAWDLGEEPLTDASGHALTPTVSGPGGVLAEGPTGSAQALDGQTFVGSPVTSLGRLTSATFAAEVRIDAGQNSYRRLFDSQPEATNWDGIVIDVTPDDRIRIITAGAEPVTTPVAVPTGAWVNLAVVIASSGAVTIHVDGVAHEGGTISGFTAIDGCNERALRFGADQGGGQAQKGAVDRVAIFPTALTAAEVATWQETAFGETPEPVAPVVSSIEPASGPLAGGTRVTLRGTGLLGATGVTVGGAAGVAGAAGAAFEVVSDTELRFTTPAVPAGTAGAVPVVVVHPNGDSVAVVFTYEAPADPGEDNPPATAGDPVDESLLTEESRGGITSPATATAGTEIAVGLPADRVGDWVSVWLHSEPAHLGWHRVDATGGILVTLPTAVLGEHRLVVLDRDGALIGWNPITLVAPSPGGGDGGTGGGGGGGTGGNGGSGGDGSGTGGTGTETGGTGSGVGGQGSGSGAGTGSNSSAGSGSGSAANTGSGSGSPDGDLAGTGAAPFAAAGLAALLLAAGTLFLILRRRRLG
ncbi:glycosyl hydrolase family 95 catalytic domain-containing protein [Herbiconiux solani]|uniref:glycosyl hydrolase family 95 catalytic domain-containing protein n=1 Tax=Herbiconiux solani TaxID=661329 RepID=UPI000A008C93|nr:glycoside hydrolase N-terminal domain-containing protein [Herbiconiux solani]